MSAGAHSCELTLHSSWRGIIGSFLGAALILLMGVLGGLAGDWGTLSLIICAIGTLCLLGLAFDYPIASTFTDDGVVRRTVLRRQPLRWERVDHLTRARPGIAASLRKLSLGGLVAVVGRRRYLLVDQPESGEEFDELERVLVDSSSEIPDIDLVIRPGDGVSPTWLYRRRHWRPERLNS